MATLYCSLYFPILTWILLIHRGEMEMVSDSGMALRWRGWPRMENCNITYRHLSASGFFISWSPLRCSIETISMKSICMAR